MSILPPKQIEFAFDRTHIDLTRCPTCGEKWLNCECPPLLETIRNLESAEYERRIRDLEAQVAELLAWKREQEGGK